MEVTLDQSLLKMVSSMVELSTRIQLTKVADDILSESYSEGDQLGLDHVNKQRNAWLKYESLNIR
jgi:hypothetical protein